MYSPFQKAGDLPENYAQYPDAFQFIKDVPVNWDDTKILAAESGDYVLITGRAKDQANRYVGAITDENERSMQIGKSDQMLILLKRK